MSPDDIAPCSLLIVQCAGARLSEEHHARMARPFSSTSWGSLLS